LHCRRCRPRRRHLCRCHPRCRHCHRRRRCRRHLINAMVKKYACVGRWCEDGRQRNKWWRLWLRLQYTQNCRYDDVGRCGPTNDRGTPGKQWSPPPRSIFQAAPLGSRQGNRRSHLGGDAQEAKLCTSLCPQIGGVNSAHAMMSMVGESLSKQSGSVVWCFFSLRSSL
jgi:hypothetical protein